MRTWVWTFVLIASAVIASAGSDTPISSLATGSPLQATDMIPIARSGSNFKLLGSDFTSQVCLLTGCTMTGPILFPNGSAGAPSIAFSSAPTKGLYLSSGILRSSTDFQTDTGKRIYIGAAGTGGNPAIFFGATQGMYFGGSTQTGLVGGSTFIVLNGTTDSIDFTTSVGGASWKISASNVFQLPGNLDFNSNFPINLAGEVSLNAQYTNATASFTVTNLSVTVVAGQTYKVQASIYLSDSTAGEGAQIDFNGGSAAATNFRMHCILNDTTTTTVSSNQVTALATAFSAATVTGAAQWQCNGTFVPTGNGTFIIRGAQNTHSSGTLTIQRGSWLSVVNSRPL